MNIFVLITSALLISEIEAGWKNGWDSQLNFRCSSDASSIYQFVSTHHNYYEDRLFDFNCRKVRSVSGLVSCSWSGYVNGYDAMVIHTCPNGGYLNGVFGVHDNYTEDRRYKFRCCTPISVHHHRHCQWTQWLNNWDETFNYFVPRNYVIRSVLSIHHNYYDSSKSEGSSILGQTLALTKLYIPGTEDSDSRFAKLSKVKTE